MSTAKKAIAGTFYVGLSSYLTIGLNLFFSIVLARLLLPEHYGVVALATAYASFAALAKDWGISSALLHKKDDLAKTTQTLFWLQILLGLASVALVALAYPLVKHYHRFDLWLVTLVLAVGGFIQAVGLVPKTLLEKELSFKGLSSLEILSIGVGGGAAVWAALAGWGLWSLVIQKLLEFFVRTLGTFILRPLSWAWGWDKGVLTWFFRSFGWPIWLSGLASIFLFQFDKLMVGYLAGEQALGFYSKAYNLALLPTGMVTGIVSRVTFPVYSSYQDQKEKLARSFSLVASGIWRLALPISLGLVLVASELIVLLIGEKWLPMVPVFRILLLYTLARLLMDDSAPLISGGLGRPAITTKALFIQAIALIGLCPLLAHYWGGWGAGLAVSVVVFGGLLYIYWQIKKSLAFSLREIFAAPLVAGALGSVAVSAVFSQSSLPLLPAIVGKLVLFSAVYLALLLLLERDKLKSEYLFFCDLYRKKEL